MKRILNIPLMILSLALLNSCLLPSDKGKLSLSLSEEDSITRKAGKADTGESQISVSNVQLINDQIIVTGSGLDEVEAVKVNQAGSESILNIVSQSASEVVLSAGSKVTLALQTLIFLTLEDAYGATVVDVTFNLPDSSVGTDKIADGAITAVKLSSMGAATGQLLRYNGTSWVPSDLDALTYAGTWDASIGGSPNVSAVGGEYYIVTNAGTADPGDGNSRDWNQGDWIVYNDTTSSWDQISNSSDVTSFNTRTGAILPQSGDYTWAMINKTTSSIGDIADVDFTTAPTNGKVLKFDGTSWVPADDLSGGGAGSVTSAEISDGAIVDADINASAAIAWSKIDKTGAVKSDVGLGNVDNIQQMPLSYLDTTNTLGSDDAKVPSQNAVKTYVDNSVSGLGTVSSITGGAGLSDGPITGSGTLDVQVDGTTIEVSADALQLKDGGINDAKISASAAIAQSKINNLTTDLSSKLNLTGGTLSGNLDMGAQQIQNIGVLALSDVGSDSLLWSLNEDASNQLVWNYNFGVRALLTSSGRLQITEICDETGSTCHDMTTAIGTSSTTGTVTSISGGNGLSDGPITSSGTLDVNVDNTTIEIVTDSLRLKDGGITNAKINASAAIDQSKINNLSTDLASKLPLSGGTMTGNISFSGAQTVDGVDISLLNTTVGTNSSDIANRLPLAGGTMTGNISFSGAQTVDGVDVSALNATVAGIDKTYVGLANVDNIQQMPLSYLDTTTTLGTSDVLVPSQNAVKAYVDAEVGAINESQWITSASDIYYNTGSVGIGTTTPQNKLHVVSSSVSNLHLSNSTTDDGLYVASPDSNEGVFGFGAGLSFSGGAITSYTAKETSAGVLRIDDGELNYYTDSALTIGNTYTPTSVFTISASGDIGIGTVSPSTKLDVEGTITGHVLRPQGLADSAAAPGIGVYNDPDTGFFRPASNVIGISNGATETMRILASGDVGIGTQTPSSKLHVVGTVTATGFNGPLTSSGISASAGTAAAPSYTFSGDSDTGLFSATADTLEVTVGGTNIFDFSSYGFGSTSAQGPLLKYTYGGQGAPNYSFNGDQDTGWFNPAADTLAAATGASERMRIDSSGNVGIGSTSITGYLSGTNTKRLHVKSSNGSSEVHIDHGGSSLGAQSGVTFSNSGTPTAFIRNQKSATSAIDAGIAFGTHNGTILSEKMRLSTDGDLGIGTTTPETKLHVLGDLKLSDDIHPAVLYVESDNSDLTWQTVADGRSFSIRLNNTTPYPLTIQEDKDIILNGGNVGIGTSSPAGTLHVFPGSAARETIITGWDNTNTDIDALIPGSTSGSIIYGPPNAHMTFALKDNDNSDGFHFITTGAGYGTDNSYDVSAMSIVASGNVGIGTTSPQAKLHIEGATDATLTSNAHPLTIGQQAGENLAIDGNEIIARNNGALAALHLQTDGGEFRLHNNLVEDKRFAVDVDGKVGIGIITPSEKLEVTGGNIKMDNNYAIGSNFTAASESSFYPIMNNITTNLTGLGPSAPQSSGMMFKADALIGFVETDLNDLVGYMDVNTSRFIWDGSIGIGTTAPSYKLDVNGTIRGYGITDSSDIRLKEKVQDLGLELDKIIALRTVSYYWKDREERTDKKQIGLIAQDVEKFYPELVETDDFGMKSVNYSHLISPVIQAIKELFQIDQNLKREVASLKEVNDKILEENKMKEEEISLLKSKNQQITQYLCFKDPSAPFCRN